ncbi:MAG: biotin--[acetyl-CoA-carboxylase] ligase [Desulfovibrionaceae bacterium]|nr:biotin--[acetyl-CoA-carboxylase] ligase [Desulfovibrionaceae bacterium]
MNSGIFLLGQGRPGLARGLDPQALASTHASWAADVSAFGPWTPVQEAGPFPGREFWASARTSERPVLVCGRCASAMDLAWDLAAQADPGALVPWTTVLAVEQTRGRGQLRRLWESQPGNLHAATFLPALDKARGWSELTPLLIGYCLALALEGLGVSPVRLKWPNDFIWQGRKVGGVLVEERRGRSMAGIGLNLVRAPQPGDLRDGYAVPAASLEVAGNAFGPLDAWLTLVRHAETCYENLLGNIEPVDFISLVSDRLAWMGRTVLVREGEGLAYRARIEGLSPNGGLVMERDGAREVLHSGGIFPIFGPGAQKAE